MVGFPWLQWIEKPVRYWFAFYRFFLYFFNQFNDFERTPMGFAWVDEVVPSFTGFPGEEMSSINENGWVSTGAAIYIFIY